MNITGILRTITSALQEPVILILLILIAVSIVLLGTLIAEIYIERGRFKIRENNLPGIIEDLHKYPEKMKETISGINILQRQKELLSELINHPNITDSERESMAVRLIEREQAVYDRRVKVSDLIAKIGPMLGLMGTLIPLGPGIIALGQGDTLTLSNSLLIAFDTTVAGLVCAFVALCISTVRKAWYKNYMSALDSLAECVLEEVAHD